MKALIISNPKARRNSTHAASGGIASRLLTAGFDVEAIASADPIPARTAILDTHADVVVAVGGDGTASAAARSMVLRSARPGSQAPPLAVYPAGTVNDFATSAGVPSALDAFCAAVIMGAGTKAANDGGISSNNMEGLWMIDMGRLIPGGISEVGAGESAGTFLNVLSVGGFMDSAFTVQPGAKARLGSLAYYLEGARKITTEPLKPVRMKWHSAESSGDEEIMLALVTNGPSAGGFKTIAPDSSYDDGLLDVIMIKSCDILDLVALFFIILSKSHLDDYRIIHFRTARIELTPPESMICTIDGEMGLKIPGVIESVPGAVKMINFRHPPSPA